jgi:Uncharacterised nucleotidyltransferase
MSNWLPTEKQRLLLRAALLDAPDAERALAEWTRTVDFDDIDHGSTRLVPLLYRNLIRLGLEHADLERMKGIYKRSWYSTLLLVHRAAPIIEALQREGVDCVIMKGLGLRELAYSNDLASRPVSDADVLVAPAHAAHAISLLEQWGFSNLGKAEFGPGRFASYHAFGFSRSELEEIDLHWRPLYHCSDRAFTERVLARSQTLMLGSASTRTLSPSDHLLVALAHGASVNEVPPIRWVADAVLLMRNHKIDWHLVLFEARATKNVSSIGVGLRWLRDNLQVDVPADVLHEIESLPSDALDRLVFATRTANVSRRSMAVRLGVDYLVRTQSESFKDRVFRFPRYASATLAGGSTSWSVAATNIIRFGPKAKP